MTTELAHVHDGEVAKPDVIRPVATAAALLETFQAYQKLERALLVDDDYQVIERKMRKKKSAWRKLATAMGVSLQLKEKAWERDEAGRIVSAEATATAQAPNGRLCDGWGGAHVTERCCPRNCRRGQRNRHHQHCPAAASGVHTDPWAHWTQPYHDLRALAETRAKNRAASDLFGFGEVSAEEIGEDGDGEAPKARRQGKREDTDDVSASTVVTAAGDVVHAESGELVEDTEADSQPAYRSGGDVDAWRKRATSLPNDAKERLVAWTNAEVDGGWRWLWRAGTPEDWSAAFAAAGVTEGAGQ